MGVGVLVAGVRTLLLDMNAVLVLLFDLVWTTGDALPTGFTGVCKTINELKSMIKSLVSLKLNKM